MTAEQWRLKRGKSESESESEKREGGGMEPAAVPVEGLCLAVLGHMNAWTAVGPCQITSFLQLVEACLSGSILTS